MFNKKIVTHPDNVPLLESLADKILGDKGHLPLYSIPVVTNSLMEKTKPTGRIVTPDGVASDREGWSWQWNRFTVLEESDLPWAIRLGIVKEETEPLFYLLDDFRIHMKFEMPKFEPRFLITSGCA